MEVENWINLPKKKNIAKYGLILTEYIKCSLHTLTYVWWGIYLLLISIVSPKKFLKHTVDLSVQ